MKNSIWSTILVCFSAILCAVGLYFLAREFDPQKPITWFALAFPLAEFTWYIVTEYIFCPSDGRHKHGDSTILLGNMAAKPVPLVGEFYQAGRSGKSRKSPGGSFSIGPLIRHGLARKNGPQYEATEKGREYLANLEALGLINRALEEQV